MVSEYHRPAEMKAVLKDYLARREEEPLFVFPTNVAAESWCDWAALHPEESGVGAVELAQFSAWDRFKGEFLSAKITERSSIPSLLRKLFVRDLIHKNNTERRIIKKIIPRSAEDDAATYAFTDWLSGILPSLKLWHDRYEALPQAERGGDDEDGDYQTVYREYSAFLEAHGFFEPAWERPEFTDRDRRIVLVYPELLEDFADYEEIFAGAANVTAVRLPEEAGEAVVAYRFSDSRKELRRVILHLRELHGQRGVRWTDMALNVPDVETYAPYLRREFGRYCVPFSLRSGKPLTRNSAGSIFKQLSECYGGNFSYSTVRALVQNEYIPWKKEREGARESLIREGSRLRCLCAYEEDGRQKDPWLESLPPRSEAFSFYRELKDGVLAICGAQSFAAIRRAWLDFKRAFLEPDSFSDEANRILGRCISELNDLIDLEEKYIAPLGLSVGPCYAFFLTELNGKIYKRQESVDGVSVFPYKLAAAANFDYHFTIDASQHNLDVQYGKLPFLSTEKRERLLDGSPDTNVSKAFVRLYAKRVPEGEVLFSYAEESFQGFAIAHTALSPVDADGYGALDAGDFILAEERDSAAAGAALAPFTAGMRRSFRAWEARMRGFGGPSDYRALPPLQERVRRLLVEKREPEGGGIKLSQTDMRNFFPCPRRWIFSQVLRVREVSLDTSLMRPYDMGDIHHKMLELFMRDYAAGERPLPVTQEDGGFGEEERDVRARLERHAATAIRLGGLGESALVQAALSAQIPLLVDTVAGFLHRLCRAPARPAAISARTSTGGFGGFYVKGAELKRSVSARDAGEDGAPAGLHYYGKIDCLLFEKGSGSRERYAIIDYKNSAGSLPDAADIFPSGDGAVLGDFQMPLYAKLVDERQLEAAYFYAIKDDRREPVIDDYIGRAAGREGPEQPKGREAFLTDVLPVFRAYTESFADSVRKGGYEALSVTGGGAEGARRNVRTYRDCHGCSFKCICRTTFTVGAKELRKTARITEDD